MPSLLELNVLPDEILDFLRKTTHFREIYQEVLYQKIIAQVAQERGLVVTPEEIQIEADCLRREQSLEKVADTLAWLADQMITVGEWEAGICDRLLAQKLANNLFASEVEKFFAQSQLDFEQILLYQIIVPFERVAQEIFYQITEEEISFYQAAHLYDIDEKRSYQCGYEGKLYRWSLQPDIATAIFGAQPGELVGPLQTEQGHHLLMVEEFIPAKLTPELQQEIVNRMFKEWLESELNYLLHNQTT
ncbi:peptidylprolyl isomerase [Chroococcidiopsis sp. FACHB-1243]|uniref:peptidylprolyl isomerase n=1 Tax=Chroococcidiopsis sp. [FACHB-1243] TaxID=2692781 RepID=UPI001780A2D1|nr:peptidylprolyl isomerase [Chroococcidiopsis sp. [FACHB-1243]]MBD2308903.1 peptidylprolyl isomerase [Chroococcidiopsis sp. [FACHB-1243]]